MEFESEMIKGYEFPVPVRDKKPKTHKCVCLLLTYDDRGRQMQDKCHAGIDNPDQPFCDSCTNDGHPQAENQHGLSTMKI